MQAHSLYLHIPFCNHRCSYCDFNTYAGIETLIPRYVEALCNEIRLISRTSTPKIPVHTIYFGGGTPSLLNTEEISQIFSAINREMELLDGVEITMEANPGKLSLGYLNSVRNLGVNRISLGMQSASSEDLQLLDRQHDFTHVIEAVGLIKKAGIENINLDIIFGIPYQTVTSFQVSLDLGISLDPDHLSLYALTIENGTPLGNWVDKGLVSEPDQDLAAEMYEIAGEKLASHGYEQYEISNWARGSADGNLLVCNHNLQYWRNQPYLGSGAGAHGYAGGIRTENESNPEKYIQLLTYPEGEIHQQEFIFPKNPAVIKTNKINQDQEMKETMLMGLRLTDEGVSRADFKNRFGVDMEDKFQSEIERLTTLDLLEWETGDCERLRLTPKGRLLGNQVFVNFV